MPDRPPLPDHLAAFYEAARPDLGTHQLWRFAFNTPPDPPPPYRSRLWYLAQLHDAVGTLESVFAVLDFALPPGEEVNEFWPGFWDSNADHGVIAIGDPEKPPLKGLLKFFSYTIAGEGVDRG